MDQVTAMLGIATAGVIGQLLIAAWRGGKRDQKLENHEQEIDELKRDRDEHGRELRQHGTRLTKLEVLRGREAGPKG